MRNTLALISCGLGGAVGSVALVMAFPAPSPALSAPAPVAVSFNDGATDCATITLSPYAPRATIVAALNDAALFVDDSGCINLAFDEAQPVHVHGIALAKDARP